MSFCKVTTDDKAEKGIPENYKLESKILKAKGTLILLDNHAYLMDNSLHNHFKLKYLVHDY